MKKILKEEASKQFQVIYQKLKSKFSCGNIQLDEDDNRYFFVVWLNGDSFTFYDCNAENDYQIYLMQYQSNTYARAKSIYTALDICDTIGSYVEVTDESGSYGELSNIVTRVSEFKDLLYWDNDRDGEFDDWEDLEKETPMENRKNAKLESLVRQIIKETSKPKQRKKLKETFNSGKDNILQPITYEDLIYTVEANVNGYTKEKVKKEFETLLKMKVEDAREEFKQNLDVIMKELA